VVAFWAPASGGAATRRATARVAPTGVVRLFAAPVHLPGLPVAGLPGGPLSGDVIWGCAEGILVLVGYVGLRPWAAAWLRERSLGTHIALAAGVAAAMLALNLLLLAVPAGHDASPGGIYAEARAQALGEAANLAGLVLGAWIGLALEQRYVRFTTDGSALHRILRYLTGLIGLLAIGLGLELLLQGIPSAAGLALRVIRYAAAALWPCSSGPGCSCGSHGSTNALLPCVLPFVPAGRPLAWFGGPGGQVQ